MQTSCKLRKDDDSKSTDQRKYRSMIGSLLYVTTSRPDVMQEALDKYFYYEYVEEYKKVKHVVTRLKWHAAVWWDEL